MLMDQPTPAPTRKVTFATLWGAIGALGGVLATWAGADAVLQWVWGPGIFGFTPMPDEIASSIITGFAAIAGAFGGGYTARESV